MEIKKILIVDDEPGIISVVKEDLELDNYEVETASSGNEALEILRREHFDFIISDVRMPGGDGKDLILGLKEMKRDIPILFMSGFSEFTVEEAKKLGAIYLLIKPMALAKIPKIIEKLKKS